MRFLKGLAITILGFLLFLALSAFALVLTLNQTVLKPEFIASQIDRFDVSSIAGEMLGEQIPQEANELLGDEFVAKVAGKTIADLDPWIKEQVNSSLHSFYDYLEGRSEKLSLVIQLEPMKQVLMENLHQALLQSPPPELASLPPVEIERYFNEFYQQLSQQIPSTFEFTEVLQTPEIMAQLVLARQIVGYVNLAYPALIGIILVLILLIILVNRKVKGSTRQIGSTFLSFGVLSYAGVFVARHIAGAQLTQLDMPVYLQALVPQLLKDTLAPLEMYSLGLLVAGVALLIVSFVCRRHQSSI